MSSHLFYAGLVTLMGFHAVGAATEMPEQNSPRLQSVPLEEFKKLEEAYATQQTKLQRVLGQDVFVSKGLVHDGRIVTFAIWTDSVQTALPKTDFVWLQDSEMSRWFVVPRSELETALGTLQELDGSSPARYLTPARIPADYFAGLEEHFEPPKGFPQRLANGRR